MDNLLSRHRNVSILVAVLFAQILGLAVQVKRAGASGNTQDTRLIRVWAIRAVTPFEKSLVWMQASTGGLWHNYMYLRGVRAENRDLKQQIEHLRLEQVRLSEDAEQARRLQLLLNFKEKFISKTLAAQVIGTSGSEKSRSIYIDKGSSDGVQPDQAVITATGIVGKVLHVYGDHTSNVLLVNDQTSGVGVILEKSRLQGILRGTANGELAVEKIMSEEAVQPGERVLTSGGDQIFPKGLDVGTVSKVNPGADSFLNIRLQPAAHLSKLEEVLIVTKVEDRAPSPAETAGPVRAVDILTRRLPSVPDKPPVTLAPATGAAGAITPKPSAPSQSAAGAAVAPGLAATAGQVVRAQSGAKPSSAGQSTAPQGNQSAAPISNAGTTPKLSPLAGDSGQGISAQTKAVAPSSIPGTTKDQTSLPSAAKPTEIRKTPEPLPQGAGASTAAPNMKAPSAPGIKPVASQDRTQPATLAPAVIQKPATPAAKTAEQSAKPAAPTSKPATKAPPEDNSH
jgi:rod shape-determining protein MreC